LLGLPVAGRLEHDARLRRAARRSASLRISAASKLSCEVTTACSRYAPRVKIRASVLALVVALLVTISCGSESEAPVEAAPADASSAAVPAKADGDGHDHAAERPRGRPLPAFNGTTLEGRRISVSDLLGKRLLIYFFNPTVRDAQSVTEAVRAISGQRGDFNFEILGVATGADSNDARSFVASQGLDFPVIDDSTARLAVRFRLREPLALLGVDAEGYVLFGLTGLEGNAGARAVETNLRRALRLPEPDDGGPSRPTAPDFAGKILDSDETFELSAHRGEGVVLIFFLHTCPHCHLALKSIRESLAALPEDKRPTLVGIEITGRTYAVREALKELDLDFFPVLFDDDGAIAGSYGVFGGVPDIFLIDAEGRISDHMDGWLEDQYPPLMRMRLARLGGAPVPMLLNSKGYSGSEVCGVCHESEHETWNFTSHAGAFDTLVKHGEDSNAECISCHVVGHGESGGFRNPTETPTLEDVGCEACHGRGGPHLSPDFVPAGGSYEKTCTGCHDAKHSLGFDYAVFRPRISHAENAALAALPHEEKQRILAERGRPGGTLLPANAAHVGSDACQSCHAAEYQTWLASPHSHAVETLAKQGKQTDEACLTCHTTGFGKPGGFPSSTPAGSDPDLGRVGCESCHGPGGDHVQESAAKFGTILSLGDKCDSCVILQICGSCHDDANDPGFEFEVQDKIDLQRHGTTEAGTGKAKDASSAGLGTADAALLAHVLTEEHRRHVGDR
jgi:peroxiredoxin